MITKQELNDLGFLKNINQTYISFSKEGWYIWAQPTEKDDVYSYVEVRQDPVPKEFVGCPTAAFTDYTNIRTLKEALERHEDVKKLETAFNLPSGDDFGWNQYNPNPYHYPSEGY